jgi:hypothetical protein
MPADGDSARLARDPPARAEIQKDRTFTMAGIHGGRRLRLIHAPPGWTLKAILAGGLEITDTPLSFGTRERSLHDVEV